MGLSSACLALILSATSEVFDAAEPGHEQVEALVVRADHRDPDVGQHDGRARLEGVLALHLDVVHLDARAWLGHVISSRGTSPKPGSSSCRA